MDYETYDARIYYFGADENHLKTICVSNGRFLSADRIRHYEDCFGPLYSVKYRGRIAFAN